MAESGTGLGTTDTTQRKRGSAKRTARACDECRLRKSKCDGLNPCEACQTTDRCKGCEMGPEPPADDRQIARTICLQREALILVLESVSLRTGSGVQEPTLLRRNGVRPH